MNYFGTGGPAATIERPVEAYQATLADARDKAEQFVRVVDNLSGGVAGYIPALLAAQEAINVEVAALLTEYVEAI